MLAYTHLNVKWVKSLSKRICVEKYLFKAWTCKHYQHDYEYQNKFCSPGLLGMTYLASLVCIHKNPNWKEFSECFESLTGLFWISCTDSKVSFWQFFNPAKMALLKPSMKFKNHFGRKTSFEALWRWYILQLSLTCPMVLQIQGLGQSE